MRRVSPPCWYHILILESCDILLLHLHALLTGFVVSWSSGLTESAQSLEWLCAYCQWEVCPSSFFPHDLANSAVIRGRGRFLLSDLLFWFLHRWKKAEMIDRFSTSSKRRWRVFCPRLRDSVLSLIWLDAVWCEVRIKYQAGLPCVRLQ